MFSHSQHSSSRLLDRGSFSETWTGDTDLAKILGITMVLAQNSLLEGTFSGQANPKETTVLTTVLRKASPQQTLASASRRLAAARSRPAHTAVPSRTHLDSPCVLELSVEEI